MAWKINFTEFAAKQLKKLNKTVSKELIDYLKEKVSKAEDPTSFGKPLRRDKFGLWRYRVRDYRIICKIYNDELTVLVIRLGHRKDIYD